MSFASFLDSIPDLPGWVPGYTPRRPARPQTASNGSGEQSPPSARNAAQGSPGDGGSAYGSTTLQRECAELAAITQGGRNNALYEAAFTVATLIPCGAVSEAEARSRLYDAAVANGLAGDDRGQVLRTIESGIRWGIDHPRSVPLRDNVSPIRASIPVVSADPLDPSGVTWDDASAEDKHVEWLIKGMVPRLGVGIMSGQSTMGKSFVSMDLAGAIATGEQFFRHRSKLTGGTLFLLGEAEATMRVRMNAMRTGKLEEVPCVDETTGQIMFDSDALPICWHTVSALSVAANMDQADRLVRKVAKEMEEQHGVPLRLIVIDTALAAFGFSEDPDAAQTQIAINGMKRLAGAIDGFCLGVHHHGKNIEAGPTGSFMWQAGPDVVLTVIGTKTVFGETKDRSLSVMKNRFGPSGWKCGFDLASVSFGNDNDGDPITGCYVVPALEATELPPAQPLTMPKAQRIFLECLTSTLAERGRDGCPYGDDGAEVRSVALDDVWPLYRLRYRPNCPPEREAENTRLAFKRASDSNIAYGRIGKRHVDGVDMVWLLDQPIDPDWLNARE